MAHRLLLLEDDPAIARTVAYCLEREGLQVLHSLLLQDARRQLQLQAFDLLVLDVGLPDGSGLDLLRELRHAPAGLRTATATPVLMLSAQGEEIDRVLGLELGADDYLPKPFEPRELVARVQTVLRRRKPAVAAAADEAATLRFEGLQIDTARRSVTRDGQAVELTGTEYELLLLLARHSGTVFSRDDILNHLRGHEADLYTRAVDIVVSRLRRKLEPLDAIKTLRNAGYALALRRAA